MKDLRLPCIPVLALALCPVFDVRAQDSGPAESEEIVRYVLVGGSVTGAVVSTPRGEEIRREYYVRDSVGNVVEIRVTYPEGGSTRSGSAPGREWFEYPGGDRVFRVYRTNGDLESEEVRRGSAVVYRVLYRYRDESGSLSVVEETRPGEGWKRVTEYGNRGLPDRETVETGNGFVTITLYEWDDRDRRIGMLVREGRSERRVRFLYGEDGTETEERTDTTGALTVRIIRHTDGSSLEERFDGGVLFARTYRKDGNLVREELYRDGLLVRSREVP
ncbi:MAG: hypothetical protein GX430_03200 [Treponema sp.]|nr:hypothetical protein [Treponema sp.]